MKGKLLIFSFIILTFISFKPVATETFVVDTKSSTIEWVAGKVGGSHQGTIKLASGNLLFEGGNLKSGDFDMNMNSMIITDLKGSSNANLLKHLKGEDFFSVVKHPISSFKITSVSAISTDRVNITGNLTIKGITTSISFPATIKTSKKVVVAVAKKVMIDRTQYDIKYRSKTIFGDIGDKAIDDEFELNINLVAKK